MLPAPHRMRSGADFSATVRSGARSGRRNVVLYLRHAAPAHPSAAEAEGAPPSRFGFIVSKAVGNSVTRNLVKRRLRAVAAEWLPQAGTGYDVVVRALPSAAEASWDQLRGDTLSALAAARRAAERGTPPRGRDQHGR